MKKTPGQIAYDAFFDDDDWDANYDKADWEDAAQAVLSSQWRSVNDPPEDQNKEVLLYGGDFDIGVFPFCQLMFDRTHWMPIPKIPEATVKEKERAEFEKWYANNTIKQDHWAKEYAWSAWLTAKKIS